MNLRDVQTVCDRLRAGASANRTASCRIGSIDRISSPGRLIATGDLHDNFRHYAKLVLAAGMDLGLPDFEPETPPPAGEQGPAHLVLHEIIHPDEQQGGLDFSYRALVRVADLKARYPEHVHTLLGNHELAQISGSGIVKDGIRVVDTFNAGVDHIFGDDAAAVHEAINEFVRSMPIALRCLTPRGDILCSHSLPTAAQMGRFDPSILSRDLTPEDYEPRRGSAYSMVWGRGYDAELLEDLVERWGVNLFILGHEKVENGAMVVPPNALVLNSDHARGVYLPIELERPLTAQQYLERVVPLAG